MKKKKSGEPKISGPEIHRHVVKRLLVYDKLNLLERFAMFLGKAQVLEFGVKGLLERRCKFKRSDMEKWTLGRTIHELEKSGLRADFIALLKVVLGCRNYVAHDLLADVAMQSILLQGDIGRLGVEHFVTGAYELERVMLLHDWCEKHDAWGPGPSLPLPKPMPVLQ